jgi:hypothetical protein
MGKFDFLLYGKVQLQHKVKGLVPIGKIGMEMMNW